MSRNKKLEPYDQVDPAWLESDPKLLKRFVIAAQEAERGHEPNVTDDPVWSEADLKSLMRLINKHGVEAVHRMADQTWPEPRRRGRPPRGDLPYYEGMHLAAWIEEQRAEHERMGHSAPLKRAINDLYGLLFSKNPKSLDPEKKDPEPPDPDEEDLKPPDPEKFAKTLKRKLYPALRNLKQQKEAAERMNAIVHNQKEREQ